MAQQPNKDRTTTPPMGRVCKGSMHFGTGCGKCEKCIREKSDIDKRGKRHSEALVYLHSNDIDINSRTDLHYKKALKIAAGIGK